MAKQLTPAEQLLHDIVNSIPQLQTAVRNAKLRICPRCSKPYVECKCDDVREEVK